VEFTIKTGSPEKHKTGTLVVGCTDGQLTGAAAIKLDNAAAGRLGNLLARGELADKAGALLFLPDLPGSACERVLIVSLGKAEEASEKNWRTAIAAAAKALSSAPAGDAAIYLSDFPLAGRDPEWAVQQIVQIFGNSAYRYTATKSAAEKSLPRGVQQLTLLADSRPGERMKQALQQGQAIAGGMLLTRELGNLPPNICTPAYLAKTAQTLGKQYKFDVEVFGRKEMEKLGMGALLAVAAGTHQSPKFIVMQYKGGKNKDKPIVLVGKGITFDSGGISLKPGPGMDEMKYDMCGAASVLGTFQALAQMSLPLNVVGLIPTTENLPGGAATKPGDVVTSMSGQTIEILNTDAEGRLILCDALTYAERFKPACVIDIATLTGAILIALGKLPSGMLSNDDGLAKELSDCGVRSGDRVWQLPLWDEYQEALKSSFADVANIGGRFAGSITAACFLARFAKNYPWAHLDIAGTAWVSGETKDATGRPVPLLSEFLLNRAHAARQR